MSRLDDELEERYPMPQDDAIIELSRRELEALRRAAYRAGRLASAGPEEREALLAEA
ncbi:hypothetical protein [Bifidobacterium myosotis]|uniref:hypothetical protein n=1 Tax=Bifidobacterium myosotis TaxID=1630166 RepID=UPI00168B3D67|nr:hypothetical protein [Bifidobacterium myosotis]